MNGFLHRIDAYLHAAPRVLCEAVELPPFTLYLSRDSESPFLSYARPSAPLDDADAQVRNVIAAFTLRERTPRWEWIDDLYPELAPALERAGINAENTPLMQVTPESFRPQSGEGFEIRRVRPEDNLLALVRAQRRSFGMEDEPLDADTEMVRGWLARGGRFYAAVSEAEIVGGGGCLPIGGVAEVAGIGTVPEARGRGIGGALTSALVAEAFGAGCDCVFLTAGDERAVRVYSRVGFEQVARGMAAMRGT